MGSGTSKTTWPKEKTKEDLLESLCVCAVKRTFKVEKYREPLSEKTRRAAQDFLFSLTYFRKQPRTWIGKVNFGLYLATFEVFPTLCCPPCFDAIVHKVAFQPPPKPTYNLIPFGHTTEGMDFRLELKPAASVFLRFLYRRCQAYTAQFHCFYIGGRRSTDRIACIYGRSLSPSPTSRKLTILYSHSNGMDIGYCTGYLAFLARRLRADVLCWDYPGYGRSGGMCSEKRLYQGIEKVYDFLVAKLKVPWEQIVAIGTSLGTAATIHLVATAERPVKGVVLQGGFTSAIRSLCPKTKKTYAFDQFVNIDKVSRIHIPTLVVHGCKDALFHISQAEDTHRQCPGAKDIKPLFLKEGLHVDFEDYLSYWHRLHKFLHTELFPRPPKDEPCCGYHPSELRRRDSNVSKGSSTSLRAVAQPSPLKHSSRAMAPVIVCERCLSLDKISLSTAVVNLESSTTKMAAASTAVSLESDSKKKSPPSAVAKTGTNTKKPSAISTVPVSSSKKSTSPVVRSSTKKKSTLPTVQKVTKKKSTPPSTRSIIKGKSGLSQAVSIEEQ